MFLGGLKALEGSCCCAAGDFTAVCVSLSGGTWQHAGLQGKTWRDWLGRGVAHEGKSLSRISAGKSLVFPNLLWLIPNQSPLQTD